MFLLADGTILLNEVAPRPHNSGHYTIEACATSQYENHLRAVLGLPLGATDLVVGARYSAFAKIKKMITTVFVVSLPMLIMSLTLQIKVFITSCSVIHLCLYMQQCCPM